MNMIIGITVRRIDEEAPSLPGLEGGREGGLVRGANTSNETDSISSANLALLIWRALDSRTSGPLAGILQFFEPFRSC